MARKAQTTEAPKFPAPGKVRLTAEATETASAVLKTRNGDVSLERLQKEADDAKSIVIDAVSRHGATQYRGLRSVTSIDRDTLRAMRAAMPESVRRRFDRAVKLLTALEAMVIALNS